MREDDVSKVMASVWEAFGNEDADARDGVIFELYRQRATLQEALQRIARYPYKGWSQQVAETTLNALNSPPSTVTERSKAFESSVNRGLAATLLKDLPAAAELMCKEGVPLDVSQRVLLHPEARRATDWHRPEETISMHRARRRSTRGAPLSL